MPKFRPPFVLLLTLLCLCAGPATEPPGKTAPPFDIKALLGDPPADGSDAQKAEIATMLKLQENRTHDEVVRCEAEVEMSPYEFGEPVIGAWFTGKGLPLTNALFIKVSRQTAVVTGAAKIIWQRNRPYITDPRIKPCVDLEKSFSYPSGHATRGVVWASILAELFPEKRDALMAHGHQYGTDRTLAGMHYPSDVAAGQKLAAEIVKRMLADPDMQASIAKAKAECAAADHGAKK
ncbi:MAG TPA: phosphatase PAP2 family protein [Tepidisphaeraceae bacterium]|jgi:hypothetical protein|nr:phosphatase PAP2 family protein [Tepidisphaeraceae bacterium]